jgi:hypothetical protein
MDNLHCIVPEMAPTAKRKHDERIQGKGGRNSQLWRKYINKITNMQERGTYGYASTNSCSRFKVYVRLSIPVLNIKQPTTHKNTGTR